MNKFLNVLKLRLDEEEELKAHFFFYSRKPMSLVKLIRNLMVSEHRVTLFRLRPSSLHGSPQTNPLCALESTLLLF